MQRMRKLKHESSHQRSSSESRKRHSPPLGFHSKQMDETTPTPSQSSSSDESERSENEFVVDFLIYVRQDPNDPKQWSYRIRWEGFSAEDDTWEPETNIPDSLRDDFWRSFGFESELRPTREVLESMPPAMMPPNQERSKIRRAKKTGVMASTNLTATSPVKEKEPPSTGAFIVEEKIEVPESMNVVKENDHRELINETKQQEPLIKKPEPEQITKKAEPKESSLKNLERRDQLIKKWESKQEESTKKSERSKATEKFRKNPLTALTEDKEFDSSRLNGSLSQFDDLFANRLLGVRRKEKSFEFCLKFVKSSQFYVWLPVERVPKERLQWMISVMNERAKNIKALKEQRDKDTSSFVSSSSFNTASITNTVNTAIAESHSRTASSRSASTTAPILNQSPAPVATPTLVATMTPVSVAVPTPATVPIPIKQPRQSKYEISVPVSELPAPKYALQNTPLKDFFLPRNAAVAATLALTSMNKPKKRVAVPFSSDESSNDSRQKQVKQRKRVSRIVDSEDIDEDDAASVASSQMKAATAASGIVDQTHPSYNENVSLLSLSKSNEFQSAFPETISLLALTKTAEYQNRFALKKEKQNNRETDNKNIRLEQQRGVLHEDKNDRMSATGLPLILEGGDENVPLPVPKLQTSPAKTNQISVKMDESDSEEVVARGSSSSVKSVPVQWKLESNAPKYDNERSQQIARSAVRSSDAIPIDQIPMHLLLCEDDDDIPLDSYFIKSTK